MPSILLRSSLRVASGSDESSFTRARSDRMSRAITWNRVRSRGPTRPRAALASTWRTCRARIGMMGARSSALAAPDGA